jgi:hypothetical protein
MSLQKAKAVSKVLDGVVKRRDWQSARQLERFQMEWWVWQCCEAGRKVLMEWRRDESDKCCEAGEKILMECWRDESGKCCERVWRFLMKWWVWKSCEKVWKVLMEWWRDETDKARDNWKVFMNRFQNLKYIVYLFK